MPTTDEATTAKRIIDARAVLSKAIADMAEEAREVLDGTSSTEEVEDFLCDISRFAFVQGVMSATCYGMTQADFMQFVMAEATNPTWRCGFLMNEVESGKS